MISYSELDKGDQIIIEKDPYEIVEASSMFKARGHSVLQVKLRNLRTGDVISKTFHPSDSFEEAQIIKIDAKFIYSHREEYVFCEQGKPSERFSLSEEKIGDKKMFLKSNQIVTALIFNEEIINIVLPIKVNLKVKQAPPGVKGDRSQSGTKTVTVETGAKINTPLFIETGDVIEVNTETGDYVRRVE